VTETTISLSEFLKICAPAGSTFPTWQVRLMEFLEQVESTSELRSRIQTHYVARSRRSNLHLLRRMNLIDGKGGVLWLSPPSTKR